MYSIFFLYEIIILQKLCSGTIDFTDVQTQQWNSFKGRFGKQYDCDDEKTRMKVYMDNLNRIADHNERFKQGEVQHSLEMNQFGDLTTEEFVRKYLIPKRDPSKISPFIHDDTNPHVSPTQIAAPEPDPHFIKTLPAASGTAPNEKNWVRERAMTNVKNQGKCGCCWAFSIAAVIESHVFIKTKTKESLSPQNLLDCVRNKYGRENSCTKGSMLDAFKYVVEAGGIETEKDYPYQEKQGDKCEYNPDKKAATVKDFKRVEAGNEKLLRDIVGLIGPIACGIDASDHAFRFYKSGIYNSKSCGQSMDSINHSLVIAGYGTEAGLDYWLVKNSWDSTWGDGGYAKIVRNSNVCSIATDTYYPIF